MQFTTASYLVFFLSVAVSYYLLPFNLRWILLLGASAVFYTLFVPWYALLFAATILITYTSGRILEHAKGKEKTCVLWTAIFLNLLPLLFFKYSNFIHANIAVLAQWIGWNYSYEMLAWLLPLGISFHTFQSISYLVEIYKKQFRAEKHVGIFALYSAFFPQLVAGPIERPQHMLPQFWEKHLLTENNIAEGGKRIILGLVKKMIIADRLAVLVNSVYAQPLEQSGTMLLIGTIAFAIQIYYDFSGYSDIAIGSARVLGFRLVENFNAPYGSRSVTEFWRRWHMSLSNWFRDYIYIPLGGNRVPYIHHVVNIMATFLLSGIWHGAHWTFVIWGGLHGVAVVLEMTMREIAGKIFLKLPGVFAGIRSYMGMIATCVFVTLAWIFFRASSVASALFIMRQIVSCIPEIVSGITHRGAAGELQGILGAIDALGFSQTDVLIIIVTLYIVTLADGFRRHEFGNGIAGRVITYGVYIACILLILNCTVLAKEAPFIYFQF